MSAEHMYLLSVFDLEPSGVMVHAYNQADSQEYILPVSEMEVGAVINAVIVLRTIYLIL